MSHNLAALAPDPASSKPVVAQFYGKIKDAVCSGWWQPDEALPSLTEFEAATGIDDFIIEQALEELVTEKWLFSNPVTGTYTITPKIDQPVSSLCSLSELLKARGFQAGSKWLTQRVCMPNLQEQHRLQLDERQAVTRLERLRLANNIIIGYERTTFAEKHLPHPQEIKGSLYDYMNAQGLQVSHAIEEISAYSCDPKMAEFCRLQAGHPMLCLTRLGYLDSGEPLELTSSYFRSDYYHYQVELNS